MPSNIEIKARVPCLARMREKIESLSDAPAEILDQEDVFFLAPSGRLKLRIFAGGHGELIFYHRADVAGPKTSDYRIAPTSEPDALKAILASVLPVVGVVRKRRWLYRVGQTRVHLDQVESLGDFIELEVVLRCDQAAEDGIAIARVLMQRLEIVEDQLLDMAYIDLLVPGP